MGQGSLLPGLVVFDLVSRPSRTSFPPSETSGGPSRPPTRSSALTRVVSPGDRYRTHVFSLPYRPFPRVEVRSLRRFLLKEGCLRPIGWGLYSRPSTDPCSQGPQLLGLHPGGPNRSLHLHYPRHPTPSFSHDRWKPFRVSQDTEGMPSWRWVVGKVGVLSSCQRRPFGRYLLSWNPLKGINPEKDRQTGGAFWCRGPCSGVRGVGEVPARGRGGRLTRRVPFHQWGDQRSPS